MGNTYPPGAAPKEPGARLLLLKTAGQRLNAFGIGKLRGPKLIQGQLNQKLQNLIRVSLGSQIPRKLFDVFHDAAFLLKNI